MNHSIENPEIANALDNICKTIVDNGGYIDPHVTFRYENDVFSIHKSGEIAGAHIIKIPHNLFIPYHSVDLDIEDGKIVAAGYDEKVSALQRQMFEDMLTLYNVTPLFQNHYKNSPWLNHQNQRQIVALLLRGRTGKDLSVIRTMLTDPDYQDELALFTFFKKRIIHTRINSRNAAITEVIIPLIEFLKHHPAGAHYENKYGTDSGGAGLMAISPVTPIDRSDECYTSYGYIDALETYMHYGFVTDKVSFVRSVPMQIEVKHLGTLAINANNIPLPAKNLPPHLEGLGIYYPKIKYFEHKQTIRLSHLIIPREKAPLSLKRVLREVVLSFGRELDEGQIKAYVADIEQQLIDKNLAFYEELSMLTNYSSASSGFIQDLNNIITCQQQIIAFYQTHLI